MRMISLGYGAAFAMAAAFGLGSSPAINMDMPRIAVLPQVPTISKPSRRMRKTTSFQKNGKREVARRLRQVAAGQLTRSNGLVTAEELQSRRVA